MVETGVKMRRLVHRKPLSNFFDKHAFQEMRQVVADQAEEYRKTATDQHEAEEKQKNKDEQEKLEAENKVSLIVRRKKGW